MSTIYGNALILPSKGEEEGTSSGFKITFPATAANWDRIDAGGIVQVDGTVVNLIDYSTLAGKTIPNVLEICVWGMDIISHV